MNIEKPKNDGYCATVVKINNIIPLAGCDNVVGTSIFGFQAIVSKDIKIGDYGIVFPAETQLSDDFCKFNDLYRHAEFNYDKKKKGYIEDNRRVKAIKFRGHTSNCLFTGLESLTYTDFDIDYLEEGTSFDTLNGHEICKKYEVYTRGSNNQPNLSKSRVQSKYLPEHIDTTNFFKNSHLIDPEKEVIVTQKLHGTSVRIGHTIVNRKLNLLEKFLRWTGIKIQETEYDYVYGSRKVIKDANDKDKKGFYDFDLWTNEGKKLVGLLPENTIVYAEILGYTPERKEIQKNYSYTIEPGLAELYVYRIAVINNQGTIHDLTYDQMVEFCNVKGIKTVPEVWRGKMKDFVATDFIDKNFFKEGMVHCLCLGDDELVDEGVVVRCDGLTPILLKAKSPKFLEMETKILDTGAEDLESSQK